MIPAMGYFARQMNTEAFGLLTLVMAFVGYASVLDGGFARAVVREIAYLGDDALNAEKILGTAIAVVSCLGILFGLLLWVCAPALVALIKVDAALEIEAVAGFRLTALMILPILLGMVWMAPMEARADFKRLNLMRSGGYLMVFGCAVVAVYGAPTFSAATMGLLIGRIAMALLGLISSRQVMGRFFYPFCRNALTHLMRFGGWLTVSSILSPAVYYLDRFVLSAFYGASAVAFYAAPSEATNKMLTLPGSVARALFPMLSAAKGVEAARLRRIAIILQAGLGLSLVIVIQIFGQDIAGIWLGRSYAQESGEIMKILVFGVLFNALSMISLIELQAMGRSKVTALVHLIEVVPLIILIVALTYFFGIKGTAVAWVGGTVMDWLLQSYFCRRARKSDALLL